MYAKAQNKFSLIFLIVALLNSIAVGTSIKSLCINTISADSIATSVPVPIAIPISAWASAGASLMPSPTIATFFPSAWSAATCSALSSGSTSLKTRSIPTCFAIASAVRLLSPVIITTSMPILCSSAIAAALLAFKVSATAMIPANCSSIAMYIGVFPSEARRWDSSSKAEISILFVTISLRLPNKRLLSAIRTFIP